MPRSLAALVTLSLLAAGTARAAPEKYSFDTRHSQVIFFANHMGFSTSEGEFHEFTGGFTFDRDNWAASSVNVEIDARSIDMDDDEWSREMAGPNFLDADQFPTIKFASTTVEKTGENTGRITGDLTLHGITRPIVIDFTFNKAAVNIVNKKFKAGFSGHTSFRRSDFGMKYGINLGFGDEIDLRLEIEGTRQ
jgi:polyisoprenoid-binding protein YceI